MSAETAQNTDPAYTAMGLTRHPDGSITRAAVPVAPIAPASYSLHDPTPVLSKDVPLNSSTNTSIRLFLPRTALDTTTKLPLIIYAHGGGFIICSASSTVFHRFCSIVALSTPALVVSVDYRLAPEHRLPTAYDDCIEAIHWLRTTDNEWLVNYGDLSNCYLMGSSAGGNIAYHVGVRACADEIGPVKIKGLILHHPFFGGVDRVPSEIRWATNPILPSSASDICWELGLPVGADRDHEYSNPMKGMKLHVLDKIKNQGWKIVVTGCDRDTVFDRQVELVKVLRENGVAVVGKFVEGEYHGYDQDLDLKPFKGEVILGAVKEIVEFHQSK